MCLILQQAFDLKKKKKSKDVSLEYFDTILPEFQILQTL